MRLFTLALSMVLSVLFFLDPAQLKAQESYTELNPSDAFTSKTSSDLSSSTKTFDENNSKAVRLGDLTIFSDESEFRFVCRPVELENFGQTLVPPDGIQECLGPFNSSTNNDCFTPGALIEGFSLIGLPFADNGDLVVITPSFFPGMTDVVVGANDFNDNSEITFQDPGIKGVGINLFTFAIDSSIVTIDVFGPGDLLLGSTQVRAAPDGPFFGVQSGESPITRIRFSNGYGVLMSNLSFGECASVENIPTMSEWGFMVLAGVLGITAFLAMRRKIAA